MKELDSKTLNELLNNLTKDGPRIIIEKVGPPASEEQIKETVMKVKALFEKQNNSNNNNTTDIKEIKLMPTQFSGYLTVSSLLEELKELEKKGFGNRIIVVSCDDEGNEYRPLPYQDILSDEDEIQEYLGEWDEDEREYDSYCAFKVFASPKEIVVL